MGTFNDIAAAASLFIPTINVLQERSLDTRLTLNIDFQNNDLYILQELTRSASLINYIHNNGREVNAYEGGAKLNMVFDAFMRINDPIAIFIDNFEQFFGMYIHSKYGRNNFKLFMKECEKSPVAYPISVFEDGMCIFMQYNKSELRSYIYSIMTMFYYYTGQSFYDMIADNKIPRPSDIDEYDNVDGRSNRTRYTAARQRKTTDDKLCDLNRHNTNINRPFVNNSMSRMDTFVTNTHFEQCILTNNFRNEQQYREVLVGQSNSKPVILTDPNRRNNDVVAIANVGCRRNGMSNDTKIFQLSEHLKRSINGERNTIPDNIDVQHEQRPECKSKTFVQTNFAKTWSCDNRRHLVSLSIIYSVMNVCIQKITYSLIDIKQNKHNTTRDISTKCDKIFSCIYNVNNDLIVDETDNNVDSTIIPKSSVKSIIKTKKATIEVSFNREQPKRAANSIPEKLHFSV